MRGEPGVGKTVLLDYLAGQAAGCRVVGAVGVQSEMELAFAGLHQLCTPLRWTFGPVGRVIVSPAYHRLHHAPDTQGVNLGVVLTIWDVLVGQARFPARGDAAGRTGLDGRPVPVEQEDSAGPALRLVAEQLAEPFQASG
jgi:hypothetical protein